MGRRYLVTGGAGFIGSNFIRYVLDNEPTRPLPTSTCLTYAGVPATVDELDEYPNHQFVKGDIRDPELVDELMPGHDVDRAFRRREPCRSIHRQGLSHSSSTNVIGTGVLLDAALRHRVPRFIHVSTDEVYGSVAEGFATEDARLDPSSAYSSSKAGSDLLARSYHLTHGYDVVVTRCTNNYGPYQFPEKVIPLFVTNLLEDRRVPSLRQREQRAGLALRRGPLLGRSTSSSTRASLVRSTTSGPMPNCPTSS